MKQKKLLKIAIKIQPNVFEVDRESDRNPELYGYEGKFLQMILNTLDVDYELIRPPDSEMGRKTKDGNWTGLVGMVYRGEADITVGSLAMTYPRTQAVPFSVPYTANGATFGLKKSGYELSNFAYVHPFDILTWFLTFCILIIMSTLFYVILSGKVSFGKTFLFTFGSVVTQSFIIIPKNPRKRNLLFGLWLLFVAVLSDSYKACLLSFLSVPFEKNTVRTFQELSVAMEEGTHRVFPPKGSFIIEYMAKSEVDSLKIVGKTIISNNWYFNETELKSNKHDGYVIVYMETPTELEIFFAGQKSKEEFIISSEEFGVAPIGYALSE
ncbi:Glutamate receptor ionotropic like protein [Argiope bruennichi]|uniref:Glutamate receptor ionotropic like protein n=1 Tax=Argiope bruennichi TaxID=94029 RepID=A0A8T0DZ00_ARGBR|nr:Glutamate receptor ionotropic like protein [Argiope bruennichi]